MKSVLKLLRPYQWTKNGLVFAVLIFSKNMLNMQLLLRSIIGFALFCCASSAIYVINDIADRKSDALHPKKCKRPIASGAISVGAAVVIFAALLAAAIVGSALLSYSFCGIIIGYLVLNLAYTFRLKHLPILDIMCPSLGFVLRTLAGSAITDVGLSPWLIMCTFLLALFLFIHKRKIEIETKGDSGRSVLKFYSSEMLRDFCSVIDASTVMAYALYCILGANNIAMMATIPFVVYGLFRYQLISHKFKDMAETPELALVRDKPLLISIALWLLICFSILYVWSV